MPPLPIPPHGSPELPTLSELALSVCAAMVKVYEASGFVPPWTGYLAVQDGEVVGTCAFKTPPVNGRVEIAYFTFPEYEGKGIATEMARELVRIAKEADPAITVFAQTLPEHNASTAILKKLGFVPARTVEHPEDGLVWEWEPGEE